MSEETTKMDKSKPVENGCKHIHTECKPLHIAGMAFCLDCKTAIPLWQAFDCLLKEMQAQLRNNNTDVAFVARDFDNVKFSDYTEREVAAKFSEFSIVNDLIEVLVAKIAAILEKKMTEISGKSTLERISRKDFNRANAIIAPDKYIEYWWQYGDINYHLLDIVPLDWPQFGWEIVEHVNQKSNTEIASGN